MHIRSKRYMRRQRARLRIAAKNLAIQAGNAPEHRLALTVAKCLQKSKHNAAPAEYNRQAVLV
jgi:hypothetical protein